MALPQEEMVPQSQLVLCTAIEEIPRPSRHLSEPEDHLFNLPCSKQVSAIHRDALQEVNKAVCQVLARTIPCKRGSYKSKALDPAQRCEIGTCASEHGISTAQKKFGVPRTTVWKLKKLYEKEKENSVGKLPIVKLDRQKRGRPTILGAFIDDLVCWEKAGILNTSNQPIVHVVPPLVLSKPLPQQNSDTDIELLARRMLGNLIQPGLELKVISLSSTSIVGIVEGQQFNWIRSAEGSFSQVIVDKGKYYLPLLAFEYILVILFIIYLDNHVDSCAQPTSSGV